MAIRFASSTAAASLHASRPDRLRPQAGMRGYDERNVDPGRRTVNFCSLGRETDMGHGAVFTISWKSLKSIDEGISAWI